MSRIAPLGAGSNAASVQAPGAGTSRPGVIGAFGWTFASHACRYLGLLVLIPFYGRVLGPDGYGRFLTAMSVYMVVWIVANWGFSAAGTRRIAVSTDRPTRIDELLRQLHGRLLTGAVALSVGAIVTATIPILRESPMLGMLACANGLVSACNVGWYFQGRGMYRSMTLIEVTNLVAGVCLVIWAVDGPTDAAFALAALLVVNLACLAVAMSVVLRDLGWPALRISGGVSLIRESAALFGAGGLAMIAANSTGLIVGLFAPASEVAYYGAADRIVSFVLALTQPIDQVVLPAVAARLGASDRSGAMRMVRRSCSTLAAAGVVAALVALFLADRAIPLLFGPGFGPSVAIMHAFAPAFPLMLLAHGLNVHVLIALHRDRAVATGLLLGTAAGLVAMLVLVPMAGGIGAAVSRSVAFTVTVVFIAVHLARSGLLAEVLRR